VHVSRAHRQPVHTRRAHCCAYLLRWVILRSCLPSLPSRVALPSPPALPAYVPAELLVPLPLHGGACCSRGCLLVTVDGPPSSGALAFKAAEDPFHTPKDSSCTDGRRSRWWSWCVVGRKDEKKHLDIFPSAVWIRMTWAHISVHNIVALGLDQIRRFRLMRVNSPPTLIFIRVEIHAVGKPTVQPKNTETFKTEKKIT
jgi:hypothetical protein